MQLLAMRDISLQCRLSVVVSLTAHYGNWWNTQHWRCQRVNARVLVFTSLQLVPGRVYCVFRELVKYVTLTVSGV